MNFSKSINASKFMMFMRELRYQNPDKKIAIFLDRLNVHRSKRVTDAFDEFGMVRILNASYQPNYNPVEGTIGLLKDKIKRKRLNAFANGKQIDLVPLIENEAAQIEQKVCLKFIKKSNQLLNEVR